MKINLKSINKIKDGKSFYGVFHCSYKEMKKTKYGDLFISLILRDSTGSIDGKLWENSVHFDAKFDQGDIVAVKGLGGLYRKKVFLNVSFIDKYVTSKYDLYGFKNNLISNVNQDTYLLWKEVYRYFKKTGDYCNLIQSIYEDYKKKILEYPYHTSPDLQKEGAYITNLSKALKICDDLLKGDDYPENYVPSLIYALVFLKKFPIIICYNKEGLYRITDEASLKGGRNVLYKFMNRYKGRIDDKDYFRIQKCLNYEKSSEYSFEVKLVEKVFKILDYASS